MRKAVSVNAMPVKTYRWLKMNEETMDLQDVAAFTSIEPEETLPAGVTAKHNCDDAAIAGVFRDAVARMKAADKDAVLPNGDVLLAGMQQDIPTGMGAAVNTLMEEAKVPVSVYTVEAKAKPAEPLSLRFTPGEGSAVLSRQVFHVKKGAEITILMDYYALKKTQGFFGVQSYLYAEEGAKVKIVRVQMLGEDFTHFDDFGAVCEKEAQAETVRLELGAHHAFSGLVVNLLGDDAAYTGETGYLCRREQQYDYNHVATHRGKKTSGNLYFHGVLLDQGKKMLRGTIDFRKGAAGADGDENEDTLQMSPDAVNRTVPIILCQEEDINGHHGATIGQLSDELLFYMQSRGISEEEAKKIVIRAKIMRVANLIPEGDLRSHVNAFLCDTL